MAAEDTKPRQLDIADYIRVVQKRKWWVLIVTGAAVMVGGLFAVSTPERYRATSLILVHQQPRGFFWISGDQPDLMPTVAMETYARIASSVKVAEATIDRLKKHSGPGRIIASVDDVRSALEVSVLEPDLLRVDATSRDRRLAVVFANETAASFVQENMAMRSAESEAASIFLAEQVEDARDELDAVMAEALGLSQRTGYVDVEAEASAAVSDLRMYENQRRQARSELQQAKAEVRRLEQAIFAEPEITVRESPASNPAWATVRQEFTTARIALKELQARYTDGHPAVQDAQARVQELEEELASTPELMPVPEVKRSNLLAGLRQQLAQAVVKVDAIQARHGALSSIIAEIHGRTEDLPADRQQAQALADRTELARNVYQNLLSELRQAKLNASITQPNAMVVDTAETPRELKASLHRSMGFALILGLFCGLGLALLAEALDDTIFTPEELARVTDVRLLGVVPLRGENGGGLVTIAAPKSPPAEAYRTLRSNIRFSLIDEPAQTFVVCSAGAGEGKSLTAANLAVAWAQGGDSVILVDTDLRRPVLHKLFEVASSPGLTNMLVGDAELSQVLTDTGVPGLRLLPTGPLPPNPAELLDSEPMDEALKRVCGEADIVILDSPPAIMLTDAGLLASKVDRTIVVAESGQITERAITDLMRILGQARANVLGIVLNKLRIGAGDYYYYYYYYYDYGEREAPAQAEES